MLFSCDEHSLVQLFFRYVLISRVICFSPSRFIVEAIMKIINSQFSPFPLTIFNIEVKWKSLLQLRSLRPFHPTLTAYYRKYHSFIHWFIHWFIDSLIHWFIHSFIYSFVHSFIRLFVHSFIRSFIHSVNLSIRYQTDDEDGNWVH